MAARRILIAANDLNWTRVMMLRLRRVGFEIDVAHRAADALELARRDPPDLVIADVQLSGGLGFGLHGAISGALGLCVPVVYLGGGAPGDNQIETHRLGAAACVGEPFAFDRLLRLIEQHLQHKHTCCKGELGVG